ncbi:Acetyltransferase (GNAT) domain-containing protein [Ruminococcaceae bacterium FB2012]|nr:Acetyltransferase (GNAT) domain-containing protein [Ruminococcaceae bacterium FB2012]
MREIAHDEVYRLEECLKALARHHNEVSVNFKGCFPKKPYSESLAAFEKALAEGRSKIAVIEEDDRTAGFCKIDLIGQEGHVDILIVLKEYRGRGYGRQLMDWAVATLRQDGALRIEIKVVDGNDAKAFYEKYGFRTVSEILRADIPS